MQAYYLKRSLLKTFEAKLKSQTTDGTKHDSILYSSEILEENVLIACDYAAETAKRTALLLRRRIMQAERKEIHSNPTL